MTLKSYNMNLSAGERSWLPVFGRNGKLAMRWSSFLNRNMYETNEQIFENLARTRRDALIGWAEHKWSFLESVAGRLYGKNPEALGRPLPRPPPG